MSRVYNLELIKLINLFEKITRARVKDAFYSKEILNFVVYQGDMGKALGKNKSNLFNIEKMLNKKIKIIEFNSNMLQFIVNLLYPYRIQDIKQDGNIVTITGTDTKTKGLIIGARAQNLRAYEEIVKKYFPELEEIKVV